MGGTGLETGMREAARPGEMETDGQTRSTEARWRKVTEKATGRWHIVPLFMSL